MLQCRSLQQITWQHPSQWRAVTLDGRPVYIRYKWGELRVSVGPIGGNDALGAKPIFHKEVGGSKDSQIDWDDVVAATGIEIVE